MEFSGSMCMCTALGGNFVNKLLFFGGDKNRILGTLVVKLDQFAAMRMLYFIHLYCFVEQRI